MILFCFSGCTAKVRDFSYISGDIVCEISFEKNGRTIRGIVHKSELKGNDVSIRFCEPQSIAGLEIKREGGIVSARFEGVYIERDIFLEMLAVEKFFEYDSVIKESEKHGEESEKMTVRRVTGEEFLLLVDGGVPIAIRGELFGEECEIKIIRFKGKILGERK